MDFSSNNKSEIFFVDGAEALLNRDQKETLSSAAAHLLESFKIVEEVDVYISKVSVLHKLAGAHARAWHVQPHYTRENHLICVFVDPEGSLREMIVALAHELIHAWQVNRGDLLDMSWKGEDYSQFPYQLQPWEIEAHGNMEQVAAYYFKDRHPSSRELQEIRAKTDAACLEIKKIAGNAHLKEKVKKIAKVAGLVGLGALLGL